MKTRKYHIFCSWILLVCFIAGQYMVFAHQHTLNNNAFKTSHFVKNPARQSINEKCSICDVMHHNNNMVSASNLVFEPAVVTGHFFKAFEYGFTSLSLILSCGRAPPFACFF